MRFGNLKSIKIKAEKIHTRKDFAVSKGKKKMSMSEKVMCGYIKELINTLEKALKSDNTEQEIRDLIDRLKSVLED